VIERSSADHKNSFPNIGAGPAFEKRGVDGCSTTAHESSRRAYCQRKDNTGM